MSAEIVWTAVPPDDCRVEKAREREREKRGEIDWARTILGMINTDDTVLLDEPGWSYIHVAI